MKRAAPIGVVASVALVVVARVFGLAAVALAAPALAAPEPMADARSSSPQAQKRYAFSHAEHQGRAPTLRCADCHDLAHTQASGAPSLRKSQCAQCHDDDIPSIATRTRELGARDALRVRFDHRPHADVIENACAQCHAQHAQRPSDERAHDDRPHDDRPHDDRPHDDRVHDEHVLVATSAVCFSCHAQRVDAGAPQERACAACHARNERDFKPATHAPSWQREHGAAVIAFAPSEHGQSCTMCHRESSCTSCHRVERPRDHGPVWGERLHGIAASFDSARCKTCHETGQCIACHRTTEPANHRGAWKSTHGLVARSQADTTCQTCHRPSFCVDCHRGRK